MSDCSIGFEVELNEVYLLENDQDTNKNRGTEEDRYLDSTPGFFLQDPHYQVLENYDYGIEKGRNKVKFDHVSKKPYERLEFESKPIIVRDYNQAVNDFNKFSIGIEAILGELRVASLTMDPTSIGKSKPRSAMREYFAATFGSEKRSLQNSVLKRIKSMKPRRVEGTVQVTYGIPMNRYRQLLSITPFGPSVPLLEMLFRQTFIGLLKVKSQWNNHQQLHPIFYYQGEEVEKIDLRDDMWSSRRSKVTFVFDVRDTKVAGNLTDLLDVLHRPNSNLYNFLFLIHNYLNVLGFVYKVNKNGGYYPDVNYTLKGYDERDINTGLKGTLPLMLRNKFSDVYKELLSSEEQRLFDKYTRVVRSVDSAMADIQTRYNLSSDTLLIAGFLDRNGSKKIDSYLPMAVQVPLLDVAIPQRRDGTDRNNHLIDYRLWLFSIKSPRNSRKLWRAKYFKRVLQKGLIRHIYPRLSSIEGEGGVFNSSIRRSDALKSKWNRIIELENNSGDYSASQEIDRLNGEIDDFIDKWVEKSIKHPDADLLSPISAYSAALSVVGEGSYAMGAYPIRNGQVLFECRECISGQKTIKQFQKVGANLVERFASDVCDLKQQKSKRRRGGRVTNRSIRNRTRFKFSRKKRAPKKSRKRRSVKKSRKPKRRSVKKSRKPKRRSVKKSRKPKRRSVKKSRKPKRRSVKKSRKTGKKKDMSYCICSGPNKTKGFTCRQHCKYGRVKKSRKPPRKNSRKNN